MFQEIADALEAPKRWLWSNVPGLHDDSGDPLTGAQVAHNAFGTDPDSVWGKALGFGLDVAGDPLNLIAPMAARGFGAAARGLGLLGDAAAPAAEATSSVSAMRGLRDSFGMIKNARPTPEGMRPLMEEALAGNGLPRRMVTTPGLNMVGEASGSVPRAVTNVLGVQLPTGLGPDALKEAAADLSAGGIGGAFYPGGEGLTTGVGVSANPLANRHEVVHGIINAAARGGETAGLPLSMRVPAALYRSDSPLLRGIAQVLDEAAAHATASRNPIGQAGHYLDFLLNPHAGYYGQIARQSPLAAGLHAGLPYAAAGGLGAAAGAAAYPFFGD